MSKVLILVIIIMGGVANISAQTKGDPKKYSEGKPRPSFKLTVSSSAHHGVVQVGPRTLFLKEGLSPDDVVRALGKATAITTRSEQGTLIASYEFARGEGRMVIVEFVNNALIRSRTETRTQVAGSSSRVSS